MQYTLYIRKGIDEQFSTEEDKSRLVNKLLETHYGSTKTYPVGTTRVPGGQVVVPKVIEEINLAPDPLTGYPCCTKAKPCKHWQWDGNKSAYINELTGESKEVSF